MTRELLEQLKKKAQACAIAIRKSEVDGRDEISPATVDELELELQELASETCACVGVSNALPFLVVELCAELLHRQTAERVRILAGAAVPRRQAPRERLEVWPTGRRQALEAWAAGKWYDQGPTREQMQDVAAWLLRSIE